MIRHKAWNNDLGSSSKWAPATFQLLIGSLLRVCCDNDVQWKYVLHGDLHPLPSEFAEIVAVVNTVCDGC